MTTAGLILWSALVLASVGAWLPIGRTAPLLSRTPVLVAVVGGEVVVTATVALLVATGPPLHPPGSWFAVGLAGLAAVLTGGAMTLGVLGLADVSSRPAGGRAQKVVLRGGAWIGALERIALFATLVAGWPEGLAAIVAVKAFARYPELKTGQATGAIERFIIGTFTSLGWAAACAGVAVVLRQP